MVSWKLSLLALLPCTASAGGTTDSCQNAPSCAGKDTADHDDSGLLQVRSNSEVLPFALSENGTCSGDAFTGGGVNCFAPWVYCTDARCDDKTFVKDGVLVAQCYCWMPSNTNQSIIPKETSGAACVSNQISPGSYPFALGGDKMCDEMKNGALISTYGPMGTKPPAVAVKCAPKTPWAWCWGAPCKRVDGKIICDCPVMTSDYDTPQYVSIEREVCEQEDFLEEEACNRMHNGSPAGGAPMKKLPQCQQSGS